MYNHKKKFGQHFLYDKNIIRKIILKLQPKCHDYFIEIGPGEGALTNPLLEKTSKITLIEKDKDLIPLLENQYKSHRSIQIIHNDILKCNLNDYARKNTRIIGNLPYNISTEIIFKILSISSYVKDIHFMLQKEVVDRMIANPGSKTYGRLSVMTQVYFNVKKLFDISPNVFIPKPKVISSYVKMIPKASCFKDPQKETNFKKLVTTVFTARRKMIKTSLKGFIDVGILENLKINPNSRPEDLNIKDYLDIAKYV